MSIIFSRKCMNKKLPLGSGTDPTTVRSLQICRDRVTLKKREPVQWGEARSPCPTAMKTRGFRARIKRSLEVKQKIVTAKFRVIQFGRKFGGGKHGCVARQFPRESEGCSNESIDKFGDFYEPRGSSFTGCHFPRAAYPPFRSAARWKRTEGFSYPPIPPHSAEVRKEQAIFSFPETG